MSSKIIEIIVSPQGQSKIETKGFTGAECREASRFLERVLGAQTEEQLTAEFHRASATSEHRAQQRG